MTIFATRTIHHVRLLGEAVEVWRPAQAVVPGADRYRLSVQPGPDDESWEFLPGDEGLTEHRQSGSDTFVAAIGRADSPSRRRSEARSRSDA